jgi:hypothetical protein
LFNIETSKGGLDIKLFEKNHENDTFKELKYEMAAQAEETIALESVIRDLGANVQGGSGYCAVMDKTFVNGLDNYFSNLQGAQALLCDNGNQNNTEMIRKLKELIINFPDFIFESSKGDLCNKMIMQNIVNLSSTVFSNKTNNEFGMYQSIG